MFVQGARCWTKKLFHKQNGCRVTVACGGEHAAECSSLAQRRASNRGCRRMGEAARMPCGLATFLEPGDLGEPLQRAAIAFVFGPANRQLVVVLIQVFVLLCP